MHLDEAVRVLGAGGAEDNEEDVAVVVVDLRPLVEPPRVLERERMEVELLAQDLEVGRLRLVDVEPEEVAGGEQLAHPVALEMEPVALVAVDEVVGARDADSEVTGRSYAGRRRPARPPGAATGS